MRVFVTGGTGLIGRRLVPLLLARGDQPVVLSRRGPHARNALGPKVEVVEGDPMQPGPWQERIDDCDAVIHLAGENVFGKRWNARFEKLLVDSRVLTTRHVAEALVRKPTRGDGQPRVLVSASAIGYYGPRGDEELDENAPPGNDFLARLCQEWESASLPVEAHGARRAVLRVGVVLDRAGGAMAKLLPPFKMFVGGPVGSGKQWMGWIHHADITGLFLFLLDRPEARGVFNGTAPHPVTNKEFSRALGKALHRPSFLPTPGFALRLLLGKVAMVVTTGQRVLPRRALEMGYTFRYPTIDGALAEIVGK